ncbi:hypothetical protein At15955_50590 (plasmid) [Agrobacterium tumefaciens]|nr:hypothetical protein Ach5_48980 [Agrobacterium tumefaciens]AYM20044.1 hypothetical protein At15955_50590 [Agrobacterium tumefaciens]AYM71347.1 hypothetical protein AtA6_51310 [Agrobacterium tumefaciens]
MKLDFPRIGRAKARRYRIYLGFQPVGLTLEDAESGKHEEVGARIMRVTRLVEI